MEPARLATGSAKQIYFWDTICPDCHGKRLKQEALSVRIKASPSLGEQGKKYSRIDGDVY